MAKILVADPIVEDGLAILRGAGDVVVRTGMSPKELLEAVADCDVLVVRSETQVTSDVIAAAKRLQAIGRAGVGVDNIDLEAATARGVLVVNAPLGNTISAAEHAIALMLALARNIPDANASLKAGAWDRSKFKGYEVRGKTLGLVGLGNVGSAVAKRAKGLEMEVLAYDPYISQERAAMLGADLAPSLDELMANSDFLSLHTVTQEQIIGENELAKARPSLRIVNTARGNHIDYDALVRAIDDGRIAGAALDVFPIEPPDPKSAVLHRPRIIVTPHLGALTAEAQERVAVDVAEQIAAILRGEPAQYAVNAPMIAAETMAVVAPYIAVAERVASLAIQLSQGQMENIEFEYLGEIANHDTAALKAAAIKGLLGRVSEENVTIVNANLIAENRGMRIVERKGPAERVYNNLIRVHLHTSAGETDVTGTLGHKGPMIAAINDVWIDIPVRQGWLLLVDNRDRPGTVGALGVLLGKHGINITSMEVESIEGKDQALMAITVDRAIEDGVLGEIGAISNILHTRVAHFA
jgi:D-3-phosphoglycerate dehydrogenase